MHKELKPCNHCGSTALTLMTDHDYNSKFIHCIQCGADGPKKQEYRWNDRIDALPTDESRILEQWLEKTNLRLERFEKLILGEMENNNKNISSYVELILQEIRDLNSIQEELYRIHGNSNSRMVYIIKIIKKLLHIP